MFIESVTEVEPTYDELVEIELSHEFDIDPDFEIPEFNSALDDGFMDEYEDFESENWFIDE